MLTADEILLLLILSIGVIGIPLRFFFKKEYYLLWSPICMVCLVFFYYAILGPLYALSKGEISIRTYDLRNYYSSAMIGCIVAFYSLLLGYLVKRRSRAKWFDPYYKISDKKLRNVGIGIIILSLFLFGIFSGGNIVSRINFLDLTQGASNLGGSFSNYLMLSINFMVVGVILLFYYYYRRKGLLLFLFAFSLVLSLFINEAFRYRLVILILSIFTAYHLYIKKKPRLVLVLSIVVPFLLLMGAMEIARQYGRGIDITKVKDKDYTEIAEQSFNETDVFWATGYFMSNVLDAYDYTYFDFIVNAVAAPIPRRLWPTKPDGSYILKVNDELFGTYGKGQAFLFFSEYYLSFGWIGVIVICFLWGYFFKSVWLWFLKYKEHPLAITSISVFNAYIYVIISRNYLNQHITLFFFTVYPAFIIIWLFRHRILNPL